MCCMCRKKQMYKVGTIQFQATTRVLGTHSLCIRGKRTTTYINYRYCCYFAFSGIKFRHSLAKIRFVSQNNIIQDLKHINSYSGGKLGGTRNKIANNLWADFRTNWLLPADVGRTWKKQSFMEKEMHSI